MKRRLAAAFLAMTLVLSGSTLAWAAEGEEDTSSDVLENVSGGEGDVVADSVKSVLPGVEVEGIEDDNTENSEAVSEETDTVEKTLKEGEKPADSGTISGTLDNGITWELTDGVLTISGNGAITNVGWNNKDIRKVIVGEGVTEIGAFIFYDCEGLTSVDISDSVTKIGDSAFSSCVSLKEIAIPSGVTEIGDGAFYGCLGLIRVDIPNSVTKIGDSAFQECMSLKEIVIPSGVTEIGSSLFFACNGLTRVDIPDRVTKIGESAFNSCVSLKEIVIPNGVTEIEDYAFSGCMSLKKIAIPSGVTSIGLYVFHKCFELTSVDIPNSVTKIEYRAFADCTSLAEITLPKSVKSIGHSAFAECKGLNKVTFEGNAPEIIKDSYKGDPFHNVRASAYCPEGNKTWTNEIMRSMGTGLVWVSEKTTPLKIVPEATDFTYVIGSSGGVTIKCTGELKDFVNVYMDGVEVDQSNYTLREGSTILTFATKYLDTLSVGKHTVTLNYTYGSIDTELTVLAPGEGNGGAAGTTGAAGTSGAGNTSGASSLTKGSSPKTGDETSLLMWVLAAMCSLGASAAVIRKKRSA
ncbi:leucine-rich repeat protein [Lachnospiraceae bacterium WCA-9-b2]|uniref:Leucine-rich repeat protein n=1 Tax=Sporofaciens musculi TaxID=2681861 RepID=A0A7X3SHH1_9FIRM|nr:leucine-rich repeat domain-containing protein [Sporofaciens musculi]MXP74409.1 leucine-rich repeat protein [Sporofaciens musculi]